MMARLATSFSQYDLDITLITARFEHHLLRQLPETIGLRLVNARTVYHLIPDVVRYLRDAHPDILLSTVTTTNVVAAWSTILAGVKTKVFLREAHVVSEALKLRTPLGQTMLRYAIRRSYPAASGVIAISRGVANDLIQIVPAIKDRIHVIYNPVIDSELERLGREKVAHPWFSGSRVPIILAVGRLVPQKDFLTLIRAFAKVRETTVARLVILGEGEERTKIVKLANELGVAEDVELLGFVENPYAYMAKANLLVLSSAFEGFGNVLVEAMAFGTPVVSTNCLSGPSEILDGGRYGTLVPVGSPSALAEAILKTLKNPVPGSVLKQRSAEFTVEAATREYLRVMGLRQ